MISPNWENGKMSSAFQYTKMYSNAHGGKKKSKLYLSADEQSMTDQERYLGVLVDSSMKVSTQCAVAVKKANSMLGIIKKGIENK